MARITSILDLDPSSLLYIFKLLSLEDQLHLARCCRLFRDAFLHLHRHDFQDVVDKDMSIRTLEDWRTFLWLCGSRIGTLESHFDDDHPLQLLPMISRHCYRLKSISIYNATVARAQPYLLRMSSLEKVYVRNYKSTSKDLIKAIGIHLPRVNSLSLESFERKELQEVRQFSEMLELGLYDEVTASEFATIVKPMRKLRCLQLRNGKRFLTTSNLRMLATNCRHLEKLTFNDCDADLLVLPQFANLKYLQLYCAEDMKTRLFKALAKSQCSIQLEYLILHRKRWIDEEQAQYISALKSLRWLVCKPRDDLCVRHLAELSRLECLSIQSAREIGETQLSLLVANNERLRYLNICYCLGITDAFVLDTLASLSIRSAHQALELFAAATDIRHDIMERLPPEFPLKMLRLNFECSDGMTSGEHFYADEPEFDRQAV
ncbi:uncharacterized protein LOC6738747 [Drosophila simulans]|uniref:GD14831 n=1 Tax=Drosophila simulans TaxID=7240 RepID=B4QRB9_DROSI|nr:uncharacterized protein LOC6738747 [Drosophila simulans]EDX11132.1 GD14831 [Drosophila simulans]KMZ00623.1 uncharacterized protein Dsimw501_GD14831 [Drosophila simulans]